MNHELRFFHDQPEGLELFLRPVALSFAHTTGLYLAHSALLDAKNSPSSAYWIGVNKP